MARSPEKGRREGGRFLPALCGSLGTGVILLVILLLLPLAVPRLMGYQVYNVVSGSMAPEIPQGSIVLVKPAAPREILAGDVIAFGREGVVTTHRVVEVHGDTLEFVTKGDANPDADFAPVPFVSLIGRVEHHVPMLGALIAPLVSHGGKLRMAAALAGGVLLRLAGSRLQAGKEREA